MAVFDDLNSPNPVTRALAIHHLITTEVERQAHTMNALNYAMQQHPKESPMRAAMFTQFGIASAMVVGLSEAARKIEESL